MKIVQNVDPAERVEHMFQTIRTVVSQTLINY